MVWLVLGLAAFAQMPREKITPSRRSDPPAETSPVAQTEGESTTVIGCLTKGAGPSQYAITDQKSGRILSFAGPDHLQNFLNQTIQLTGTMMNRSSSQMFRPEGLKPVAASCHRRAQ